MAWFFSFYDGTLSEILVMEYELMYHSYASPHITNNEINAILEVAKTYNAEHDITGCLMYHNKQFVQLLEGNVVELDLLMDKISKDQRHSGVKVIYKEKITSRLFWKAPMAFDVVDKDDFKNIGIYHQTDLEFIKNDFVSGKKLFQRLSNLVNDPVDHMHSKPFGPSI